MDFRSIASSELFDCIRKVDKSIFENSTIATTSINAITAIMKRKKSLFELSLEFTGVVSFIVLSFLRWDRSNHS